MLESIEDDLAFDELLKLFRQKLCDFHANGKPDQIPEYAVHRILYLFDTVPELTQDHQLREAKQLLLASITNKYSQFNPLRCSLHQDISQINCHIDLPSYNILRDGCGLEHLEFVHKVLQPWELLIDIGHNASYMYDFLLKTLSEFKGIDEKVMALTILQLAIYHQRKEDHISKIIYNTFESNKDGNPTSIKKEPEDKKTQMSWSIDNLARAFRELYSTLNWNKVFESFSEIEDEEINYAYLDNGLDQKQFQTLMQLFNKSKPQNILFPLQSILQQEWKSSLLQLTFIKNCIQLYTQKKEKSIQFNKLKNKINTISELQEIKERGESNEVIEVWQSIDLIERLIILSEKQGLFVKVRKVFDHPLKQLPEYLLLSLSVSKTLSGNVMIDELLSILLPIFLGNHVNSSIVLQKLYEMNKNLFIRGICENCKHDQRLMNLSRVLDITQEVKDSLLAIVYCDNYNFAVNLGILAGKRDFLHYDVWIQSRIKDVGSPFIDSLIKYIYEHIIYPVGDFIKKNKNTAEQNLENFEAQKTAIMEKSHLTKEKLLLTIENLLNPSLRSNDKVTRETLKSIQELAIKNQELFPQHYEPGQNSEEIDAAANEHFQRVFSAEDNQVDTRIQELIQTMQNFKESQEVKEQEIYACMLHGLFDEYRFLHRYPQQYLTKIAKLFGAIIKNNLLDRVLQDIALKFVIEAFRRDGRRQKFGIIVIKSFFEMLPQFPKFLEEIYQIRQSIQSSEPQMMADIERLYHEMVQYQNTSAAPASRQDGQEQIVNIQSNEGKQNSQSQENIQQEENQKQFNDTNNSQMINHQSDQKGDKSKLNNAQDQKQVPAQAQQKDQNMKSASNFRQTPQIQAQVNQNSKSNQKNQRQTQMQQSQNQFNQQVLQNSTSAAQNQQILSKSMTPPLITQAKEFVPTNRGVQGAPKLSGQQFQQTNQVNQMPLLAQQKVFLPTNNNLQQNVLQTQPSQMVDQMNSMNLYQQSPQFKVNQQQTKQQTNNFQAQSSSNIAGTNISATGGSTSLNIRSAEFQRPLSTSNFASASLTLPYEKININSKEFQPSKQTLDQLHIHNARNSISQFQIQELLGFQKQIDEIIKRAIENSTKIRLADLLEDDSIKVQSEYVEDQIRIICNHTDRGNFKSKIEDLKKFVIKKPSVIGDDGIEIIDEKSQKADDHLRWFIHCILTKRLGQQGATLMPIYVEMIRELNYAVQKVNKLQNVISITLNQAALIFKKCMLVNEEDFLRVTNVAQGQVSMIKSYLSSLGSFVGVLTLQKNEPIRNCYLDLKQILIEGFQTKNRKLAVTFICRILKETQHSRVFTAKNPWMHSLFSLLKEIYELCQLQQNKQLNADNLMEIDSLFKALGLNNSPEIKSCGLLQSIENPSQFVEQAVRKEIEYMYKRIKIVMPQMPAPPANSSAGEEMRMLNKNILINSNNQIQILSGNAIGGETLEQNNQTSQTQISEQEFLRQQVHRISRSVSVSNELIQIFKRFPNFNEQKVRKIVGNAVDNSIVEILPPVVDRSVTIALITTRELVLKDFAYDGDFKRVLKAADLIVQNLAGSLALVTCREPLRMSLIQNFKNKFDQYFRQELGVEVISRNNGAAQSDQLDISTDIGSSCGFAPSISNEINFDLNNQNIQGQNEGENLLQMTITDEQLGDIAVLASKENLELGCKLIKKEVIEKALKKVREDSTIMQAVDNRKLSEERGVKLYRDPRMVAQFLDLPPQLQPNPNGLTPAQFQVYEDFQKLGQPLKDTEVPQNIQTLAGSSADNQQELTSSQVSQQQNIQYPAQPTNLTQILNLIQQQGLTEQNKGFLLNKLNLMNTSNPSDEEHQKLWTYVQRQLELACKSYDSRNPQEVDPIINILSLIVTNYKVDNLSKKLLTNVFLQLDVRIFNEVELNILLMSKKIISISEWDRQLAVFFKESASQLPESELQFFANFLQTSIVDKKILTQEEVPQLISVIEQMTPDKKIGQFCQYILENLNFKSPIIQQNETNLLSLKDFFIKWVVTSYIDDKENQEKQINILYQQLGGMGIDSDPKLLYSFCKVMIQTSIEKTIIYGDESGEKRPPDRLDFRYIDSFVKLIVFILKMFSFNKHEFMTKVLEFIGEVLEEDYRVNTVQFNQRPYYRMLMNILTAVNHSGCFNQKTQGLILFSIADLFKSLSPSFYPGFSFSWLELISHKQFLPHFLKSQQPLQISPAFNQGIPSASQAYANMNTFQNQGKLNQTTNDSSAFAEKRSKIKDLIVNLFIFLKSNMTPGTSMPPAIQAFYHATLRVLAVIRHDYPDFLSDYHFYLVNSLPEHCLQIKNLILSACPANVKQPDPFHEELKIDLLDEIKQVPRILSTYEDCLSFMNLREDLENCLRNRSTQLIQEICHKMEQSEEIINGKRQINSAIINAVVLFLVQQGQQNTGLEKARPQRDIFKQIAQRLNDETRLCFLNSIVNELRYPSKHTFDFSCTILSIYAEAGREIVNEQISQIFLERLQTTGPCPWGLMISFRELIQNPKLEFMKKLYIKEHTQSITYLFKTKLRDFVKFLPAHLRNSLIRVELNERQLVGQNSGPPPGAGSAAISRY